MSEPFRIQQLRQFVMSVENGSFRAAATGTFRSQAAVSTAMRDLEQQIGAQLFERGQRARLTALGQTLYPLLKTFVFSHDRLLEDVNHLARAERGSVSVAVAPFLAEQWFPGVLKEFLKGYPEVRLNVTDDRSRQIRRLVANGDIDIGVAAKLSDDPSIDFEPIAVDQFGVALRKDHPLAKIKKPLTWKSISDQPLMGNDAFEMLSAHGLSDISEQPMMFVSSRPSMIMCVENGLGVAVIPKLTMPENAPNLTFIPLRQPQVTRTVGVMKRRGQTLLPAAERMWSLIITSLRAYTKAKGATQVTDAGKKAP